MNTLDEDWWSLERIIPISRVSRITSLSEDTIKRRYKDRIVQLSPRRIGMKLKDALAITAGRSES
jgi:hypothetical protein